VDKTALQQNPEFPRVMQNLEENVATITEHTSEAAVQRWQRAEHAAWCQSECRPRPAL